MNRSLSDMAGPIAAGVLLALVATLCFSATVDDAFIAFCYSRNVAAGEGPVFNPGERVEGYSSPLWMLLASALEVAKADTVRWAKFLGVAASILAMVVVAAVARRHLNLPPGITIYGLLYLATSIGIIFYSTSGLETTTYMLEIVLLCYLLLEKRMVAAGVVSGLIILTRPEGVLFVVPLAAALWVNRSSLREAVTVLLIPVAFAAALVAWRWSYYGSLLPHTHYSKVDVSLSPAAFLALHTKALVTYTFRGFRGSESILALAILGAIHLGRRKLLPLAVSVLAVATFIWYSAGDWMSFSRFCVPALPLVALFWLGAAHTLRRSLTGRVPRMAGLIGLFAVPLLLNIVNTAVSVRELEANATHNPAMHSKTHTEVADYLMAVSSPGDVVALNEPGAVAYYSGLTVVDMSGKTDATAARLEREGRTDDYARYVLSREPRYILLNDRQEPWDTDFHPLHKAVYVRLLQTGLYTEERTFPLNYYKNLLLFVRRDETPPRATIDASARG